MKKPKSVSTVPVESSNIVTQSLKALNMTSSKKFVLKKPASSTNDARFFASNPKSDSSQSSTPSPQLMSSSTEYPKKMSTSTTDQNPSSHTLSSSKETTPASANSSTNEIQKQILPKPVKKSSHVTFQKSLEMDDCLNESQSMSVPQILEVFTGK